MLWGCIAWIVIGGGLNIGFALLSRYWEKEQYKKKVKQLIPRGTKFHERELILKP